jgi:hypothetical protein
LHQFGNNTSKARWVSKPRKMIVRFGVLQADYDFSKTFGKQLEDRRDFAHDRGTAFSAMNGQILQE